MAIWRRVACWISKATRAEAHACARIHMRAHAHKYIILSAVPWQRLFHEPASELRSLF